MELLSHHFVQLKGKKRIVKLNVDNGRQCKSAKGLGNEISKRATAIAVWKRNVCGGKFRIKAHDRRQCFDLTETKQYGFYKRVVILVITSRQSHYPINTMANGSIFYNHTWIKHTYCTNNSQMTSHAVWNFRKGIHWVNYDRDNFNFSNNFHDIFDFHFLRQMYR